MRIHRKRHELAERSAPPHRQARKFASLGGSVVAATVGLGIVTLAPTAHGVSALDACAPTCAYTTTTTIAPSSPDPSATGSSLALAGTVTVVDPGDTFPTQATLQGQVVISDGTDSCTDTTLVATATPKVFAFGCEVTPSTSGAKTYTATYTDTSATATIDASSGTEAHQVYTQAVIAITSPLTDVNGDGTTTLTIAITPSGACAQLVPVVMTLTPLSGPPIVLNATTDNSGVATSIPDLARGVYVVAVTAADSQTCHYTAASGILNVLSVFNASTGGGWYRVDATPSRVHFGYSVKVIARGSNPKVAGRILWMNNHKNKLVGSITGYQVPVSCPVVGSMEFVKCAKLIGTATLYDYNSDTEMWVNPRTVTFQVWIGDVGRVHARGKRAPHFGRGDAFGLTIDREAVAGESAPLQLSGGNIRIR